MAGSDVICQGLFWIFTISLSSPKSPRFWRRSIVAWVVDASYPVDNVPLSYDLYVNDLLSGYRARNHQMISEMTFIEGGLHETFPAQLYYLLYKKFLLFIKTSCFGIR